MCPEKVTIVVRAKECINIEELIEKTNKPWEVKSAKQKIKGRYTSSLPVSDKQTVMQIFFCWSKA